MSPRTLLLSDIFPPKTGGSGRWFWEIYSRLPREQVLVAAGDDPRAAEFDRTHGLPIMRLPLEMRTRGLRPFGNLKRYVSLTRRVRRLAKREQITMIHAARTLPEGFIAYLVRRTRGIPYLVYVHGEEIGVSATSRELSWMTRRVFRAASLVIANSRNTRSILLTDWHLPEDKVRTAESRCGYAPIRTDAPRRVPTPRTRLGRTNCITDGRPAAKAQRTRHAHPCACPPSVERQPNVLYAIVGDGHERATLESLAKSEGEMEHVQFLSELSDEQLVHCYQQSDLFVLPNRAIGRDVEGFGMVLLEAQACGKPVVAGASGGTAETMRSA